jgi:hypothetical protein
MRIGQFACERRIKDRFGDRREFLVDWTMSLVETSYQKYEMAPSPRKKQMDTRSFSG